MIAKRVNAPETTWYFAEGNTYSNFEEYLTVQNPNTSGTVYPYRLPLINHKHLAGGGRRARTAGLGLAKPALSQLSYTPEFEWQLLYHLRIAFNFGVRSFF